MIASVRQRKSGAPAAPRPVLDGEQARRLVESLLQSSVIGEAKKLAQRVPKTLEIAKGVNSWLDAKRAVSPEKLADLRKLLAAFNRTSDDVITHRRQVTELASKLDGEDGVVHRQVREFTQESLELLKELAPAIEALGRVLQRADPTPRKSGLHGADRGMEASEAREDLKDNRAFSHAEARPNHRPSPTTVEDIENAGGQGIEALLECLSAHDQKASVALWDHFKSMENAFARNGKAEFDTRLLAEQTKRALASHIDDPELLVAVANAFAEAIVRR